MRNSIEKVVTYVAWIKFALIVSHSTIYQLVYVNWTYYKMYTLYRLSNASSATCTPFAILATSSTSESTIRLEDDHKVPVFLRELIIAAYATGAACIGSNPMEVVKTRMQLQGELAMKSGSNTRYRNFAHAFYTICRTEGLGGIQRGLIPGISYQAAMNGPRLGLFEPLQQFFGATDPSRATFPILNILAGASSGVIGAVFGSPFSIVKTRIQATSSSSTNGKYQYAGMIDGFRQILRAEGITGFFRGLTATVPRIAIGSAIQLSTYAQAKNFVMEAGFEDGLMVHFGSSIVSGLAVTTAINPLDVISTRLYSQRVINGKGELYDNLTDSIRKTYKAEGLRAFYKGWTAHYLRVGPHTILTFILWEQAKRLVIKYQL
uniref:Mitochondrial Carrier (MC) Family putative n=1 Tax=Albugo laibachii Nc14 TaxID=890382 RepID=F0WV46_9STRA|nr:Mitochondrial Carrier (MC) Family putative [Albugo laibachii Nc14]|eukprot:CCA25283.1 Mitochondrial Carrier (MC) Family putative [Albugo laibachii Nc14]